MAEQRRTAACSGSVSPSHSLSSAASTSACLPAKLRVVIRFGLTAEQQSALQSEYRFRCSLIRPPFRRRTATGVRKVQPLESAGGALHVPACFLPRLPD